MLAVLTFLSFDRLIAIMLGRLKMDVQECIDEYVSMFEEIFGRKAHKNKVSIALQIQPQYDSEILRRCILRIVQRRSNISECDNEVIADVAGFSGPKKVQQTPLDAAASKILLDDGVPRGCRT